jgi:murein DD-endopeptidase MepM/ murein hydrolase activator NlpD
VKRATLILTLSAMVIVFFLVFGPARASPALQLPWPSGHQHRISGGNTYNCDTHDRGTATGGPPLYNADQYGVDFQFGPIDGSPLGVAATASGTVVFRSNNFDNYGYKVVIDHGGGLVSVYAHLRTNSWAAGIIVGASVTAGQLLADAGGTGNSENQYPVHLHFHMMLGNGSYLPEPMSGVSGFGQYGACTGLTSQYWISTPVWQPNGAYQNWGTLWGGVTETATASAHDMSQTKFVALTRVNASAGGVAQWRQWNYNNGGTWNNWTTISGLTGINGKIAMSNHRNGSQEQLHVAAVKNGDVYHTSRIGTGSWASWTNVGHPSGVTFDAP